MGALHAQTVSDCPGQGGGLYDQIANTFSQGVSTGLGLGTAIGGVIFASYMTFRWTVILIEAALAVDGGMSVRTVLAKLMPSLVPMLVSLGFINAWPTLVPLLLQWAPQWGTQVSGASGLFTSIDNISPSSVFGTFNCLSNLVDDASNSWNPITVIANFIPTMIATWGLEIAGALIATSLLCVEIEADFVIPIGAPSLGGLAGPDGSAIAKGYLTAVWGIVLKIATCNAVAGVGMKLTQGWVSVASGGVNLLAYGDMIAACVMFCIAAWLIPHIAARAAGGPAAMTTIQLVGLVGQIASGTRSVMPNSSSGGGGGSNSGSSKSAETSAGNGAQSGGGKNEVFGRALP